MELLVLLIVIAVVALGSIAALLAPRARPRVKTRPGGLTAPKPPVRLAPQQAPPQPGVDYRPGVGDDAEIPRDSPLRGVEQVELPSEVLPEAPDDLSTLETAPPAVVEAPVVAAPPVEVPPARALDVPLPSVGRLIRLRARLSRSQNSLGKGLFALLSRDNLDEDTWDEIEETLLTADVGVGATTEVVDRLRTKVKVLGTRTPAGLRELVEGELLQLIGSQDRSIADTRRDDGSPSVILVVGVNGVGKTTTCGKLGRSLVGDGRTVLMGAADTFRAAAADQLTTWGERVGARVVRGPEQSDPAAVAFDAVKAGLAAGVDVVLIDTAGRLHTKTGLMDELGKIKRVVEKQTTVDEVLLVLDATTGQNGVTQAKVFLEQVDVTGIVLTKLDGTAKGGIVIAVQRALGIPVKLIGLGEGPDDLAPFDPTAFVDALLGDAGR